MKRFSLFFFMVAVFTANVFAADATISRVIPNKNVAENSERIENSNVKNRSARTVSRMAPNATKSSTKTVNVVSRSANNRKNNSSASLNAAVNTVGRSARTDAASINNAPSLRRAGITLRASTAEVGGRATIGNTGVQTGSNIDEQVRGIQSRASIFSGTKKTEVTAESLANAKDVLEKTSDLNNTCQQQYNECMDQFCAVVDANQKRCSCSANLAKYAKAQKAVEDANAELNDVAQRIRYVGLSADEIRAIMSATEAELEMGKTKDSTQTRSMLDDIAEMLKDPTSSTTLTSSTTSDSLLDMDLDFSSDSSDLFSLDIFNASNTDISSKRGKALYAEAKKRCKTVLNRCKDAGGTENQISGNYDLAIDKDCVAYEQGLVKLNDTLKNNVRSANLMLQKARLAVLQNKNQYGIKECVAALESCMLDDMVCGEDYIKCVDPTKMFIDENGKVILGRNIANITNSMTAYDNTKINTDFIKNSIGDTTCSNHDGACVVNYLMTKIGMGATVKDGGLCRAVLDKCQDYTYTQSGKTSTYNPYNDVIVNYIQRAMVNIKSAQSKIISNYAANCLSDVQDCYTQQNSQVATWTSTATIDNIYKVLTGTCYNTALTCGYAVFAYDTEMSEKTCCAIADNDTEAGCRMNSSSNSCSVNACSCRGYYYDIERVSNKNAIQSKMNMALIEGISQMFYQTMLCPDNSEYVTQPATNMVNDKCACKTGYIVSGGQCVLCAGYEFGGFCYNNCPLGTVPYISGEQKTCLFSTSETPIYGWAKYNSNWAAGYSGTPWVSGQYLCTYIPRNDNCHDTDGWEERPEFPSGTDVIVKFSNGLMFVRVALSSSPKGDGYPEQLGSGNYCWGKITKYETNDGSTYSFDFPWFYMTDIPSSYTSSDDKMSYCFGSGIATFRTQATRQSAFGKYGN